MSEPLEIEIVGNHVRNVSGEAAATGAIARNGLVADQPVMWNMAGDYFYQFKDPTVYDSVVEFHDPELRSKLTLPEEEEQSLQRPTTASTPPPEFIPDTAQAKAVCLSPDVCKTPDKPIPYMVHGQGCDDRNYSPNVSSNGDLVKHAQSVFTTTHGDEPGIGKGVCSGTVGDVVEPVTSSPIVRVNGIPVQRHADRCTLNNGNCPGEYVHVNSVETHAAPDATDEDDRNEAQKGWDGFYNNSGEAQMIGDGISRVGDYFGDPSLIGQDIQSGVDAIPSWEEAQQWGSDVGTGIKNTAEDVWNDPGGAAKGVWDWGYDGITGAWDGLTGAYDEGGVSQAGGHLAATVLSVVNPLRKAKMVGNAADGLGDLGQAARRLDGHGDHHDNNNRRDNHGDQNEGDDGVRSTRVVPTKDVECFNKPSHLSDDEFDKQLKEQQAAINDMDAELMLARRKAIRDAGGTSPLRYLPAQGQARTNYENNRLAELADEGIVGDAAKQKIDNELSKLAATHRLDIIAGGDASDISGMGDRSVNSSLGAQWRGRRSQSLEDYAAEMKAGGMGKEKMKVTLRKC